LEEAFEESALFARLSEPERERLQKTLGRLRIEFDVRGLELEPPAATASQVEALERLQKCFSSVAEFQRETIPTLGAVTAALEEAARQSASDVSSKVAKLNEAIESIHATASTAGKITKDKFEDLQSLIARLNYATQELPFDPNDESGPSAFVRRLFTDAKVAAAISRKAKKILRAAGSSGGMRIAGDLTPIQWLAGDALQRVFEEFSGRKFPASNRGFTFVQNALQAMNIPPSKGRRRKHSLETLKVHRRAAISKSGRLEGSD
jgi:hypothetical protein